MFCGCDPKKFNPQEATNTITVPVIFQIDKGTVTTLPVVTLGFSAQSGTNPQIHPSPKGTTSTPVNSPVSPGVTLGVQTGIFPQE